MQSTPNDWRWLITMYMAVTPDEYEIPIAVCDTARELGERMKVSKEVVLSSISRKQSGKTRGFKFVKVDDWRDYD